jgi:long-chain acyl-CoA synthetase
MLKRILREQQLRDIRLWQRTELVPQAMLVAGHETLAKSFGWKERGSRRTAFLLGNEPVFSAALLAVMRRGDSAVLLNPALASTEITDVLKRTTPRLIVTSTEHLPKLQQLPNIGKQIEEIRFHPFGDILAFDICLDDELVMVRNDEFICQVTSGVSGKSRIVSRTYANIDEELENYAKFVGMSDLDILFCPVPLFHSYGLFVGLLPSFAIGADCVLAPGLSTHDIVELTRFHTPTILLGVPFIYELVTKSASNVECNFGGYRYLFSAGAPLTEHLASQVLIKLRATLNPLYGTTETGVISVGLDRRPFVPGFVGSPIAGKNIRIFGENRAELPLGDRGEIGVRSNATGSYLDQEQVTASFNDAWFLPGDMGSSDADGNLYVTGRKFSVINVASLKVDPIEVEAALFSSGLAADCAVVGVPRKEYGEFVRAYVVPNDGVSVNDLRAVCRQRLAPFKVPREFILVEDLPRSAAGKVLRKYLTDPNFGSQRYAP